MPYINFNALTQEQRDAMRAAYTSSQRGYAMWDQIYFLSCILSSRWYDSDRGWHSREQRKYNLHPVIRTAVYRSEPANWHLLVLEWPHISEGDPARLAYTRSDEHGKSDRQTVTTIGKYLRRHFPLLKDDEIRDLAAAFDAGKCYILRDMDKILDALSRGPQSCMKWHDCHCENHPYRTYDPSLGWGLAVREVNGDIKARALVYEGSAYHHIDTPYVVRSFNKPDDGGYSYTDTRLEAWLKEQGYEKRDYYDNALLSYIPYKGTFVAPYIDGSNQEVDIVTVWDADGGNARKALRITDSGEYTCNNTDGFPREAQAECYCDCCGEYYHEDEMRYVGYNDNDMVCEGCRDYSYTYVRGRNGYEYYTHNDNAVYVECRDEYYHENFLSDNGIIVDVDGEYQEKDECVYINYDWYRTDDDRVVEDVDGEYRLADECEEVDGSYYLRDDERIVCNDDGEYVLASEIEDEEEGE